MDCTKIIKKLPDYRLGRGKLSQRRAIEAHLQNCAACQEELRIWENFCAFSAQQLRIPETLDWTPLQRALEAELRRLPGARTAASKQRKSFRARRLQPAIPRRFAYPLLIAGAAVMVILGLGSGRFQQTHPALKHKLILGSEFVAQESDGRLVYREARATQIYHQDACRFVLAQDNLPNWQDIPDQTE